MNIEPTHRKPERVASRKAIYKQTPFSAFSSRHLIILYPHIRHKGFVCFNSKIRLKIKAVNQLCFWECGGNESDDRVCLLRLFFFGKKLYGETNRVSHSLWYHCVNLCHEIHLRLWKINGPICNITSAIASSASSVNRFHLNFSFLSIISKDLIGSRHFSLIADQHSVLFSPTTNFLCCIGAVLVCIASVLLSSINFSQNKIALFAPWNDLDVSVSFYLLVFVYDFEYKYGFNSPTSLVIAYVCLLFVFFSAFIYVFCIDLNRSFIFIH